MLTLHDRDRCISQFDHGRDATAYHHGGQQFLCFQSSSQTHYAHYAGRVHSRKRKATVGTDRQSVCLSVSVCPVFFSPVNPDAATVYISSCQGPICLLLLEVMLVDNLSYTVIFLYRLYSGQTPVFKKYYLSIQGYMQETAM